MGMYYAEAVPPFLIMFKRIFLAVLVGSLIAPFAVHAVTVGPVRLEYFVNPGDTMQGSMVVINEDQETKTFYPSFERFTEDNGQKIFTKETSDLSTWFNMAPSIELKPGEQRFVPFTIEVPQDGAPGGHFAVIWWSTTPPGSGGQQVAIVTRAGVLVYLTVAGDIEESGIVEDLTANQASLWNKGPISFTTAFKNTGNVSLKPAGTLTVKNLFGMTVGTIPVNRDGAAVLPQSRKSFTSDWADDGARFGLYRAHLDITFGQSNSKAEAGIWFWVLPWQYDLIVLIVLLIIIFLPSSVRRYNRWIVERSRK